MPGPRGLEDCVGTKGLAGATPRNHASLKVKWTKRRRELRKFGVFGFKDVIANHCPYWTSLGRGSHRERHNNRGFHQTGAAMLSAEREPD
jgi:hypothetical protein